MHKICWVWIVDTVGHLAIMFGLCRVRVNISFIKLLDWGQAICLLWQFSHWLRRGVQLPLHSTSASEIVCDSSGYSTVREHLFFHKAFFVFSCDQWCNILCFNLLKDFVWPFKIRPYCLILINFSRFHTWKSAPRSKPKFTFWYILYFQNVLGWFHNASMRAH